MTGRIPFGLLLSLTVLVCWPIQAQDQGGPPPGYYGVQPAGYLSHQDDEVGQYRAMPNYSFQRGSAPPMQGPPPRVVYEQLPDDLGFKDPDTPIGNWLTNTFQHGWFRGEYLLYNISGPGSALLGAQASGVPNSTAQGGNGSVVGLVNNGSSGQTFNINGGNSTVPLQQGAIFTRTVDSVTGVSQSPTMDNTSITGLSGFRGTYGLPLPVGSVELSGFVLGTSSSDFNGNNLIVPQIAANNASTVGSPVGTNGLPAVNFQQATFISQALLVNGAVSAYSSTSSNFIDYDVSYHAKLLTTAWGTEGNYVFDDPDPMGVFHLRPMLGFRYFNFRDRLNQGGQYNQANATDPTAAPTVVSREIDSSSNNNLYGPQIGLRAEYAQPGFAIGFEPKLLMALNTYTQTLNTQNVLSSSDPAQNITGGSTTFSPLVDLKVYSNVALSKYVAAFVSYNFIYVGDVNRSYNDIVYNKTVSGTVNQSDFSLTKTISNVTLQGISVGFDVRY